MELKWDFQSWGKILIEYCLKLTICVINLYSLFNWEWIYLESNKKNSVLC